MSFVAASNDFLLLAWCVFCAASSDVAVSEDENAAITVAVAVGGESEHFAPFCNFFLEPLLRMAARSAFCALAAGGGIVVRLDVTIGVAAGVWAECGDTDLAAGTGRGPRDIGRPGLAPRGAGRPDLAVDASPGSFELAETMLLVIPGGRARGVIVRGLGGRTV